MIPANNILTTADKNLCEYGGGLGVALTLTCLIQHFIVVIPGPVTDPMIPIYIFSIVGFLLFALQKFFSIIMLIASGLFVLIIEYLWFTHYSFSLVVALLFIYHIIIIVILFATGIPAKLIMKKKAEKAERDMWAGKI